MRAPAFCAALAALLSATTAFDHIIQDLSFGQTGRPDGNSRVPNYILSGHPYQPEQLSNKIILTPVAPGNQRGALWAEKPLSRSYFSAHVDFRANGPERGGGNLNVWLVHGGSSVVGSHSIYTVGKFDGLGLVVDAYGGSGGMIRGFLNDGSVDYSQQHDIDRLAFGHCQFSYRNLGRPTTLSLFQTQHALRVEVDGHLCFETDHASIPSGNFLGVTAATPDTPDSFEIFAMVVSSDAPDNHEHDSSHFGQQKQPGPPAAAAAPNPPHHDEHQRYQQFKSPSDEPADHFATSAAQFRDLHNRLQSLTHHLSSISAELANYDHYNEQRNDQVTKALDALRSRLPAGSDLVARVQDLEKEVRAMRNDMNKGLASHHDSFQDYLSDHHDSLAQTMMHSMPGHGKIIFVIVASQVVLAVGYVLYKRRKASSPKKYL
ncbi:hypothetical protein CDD80_1591 [Ophiocordyceps camponoti-rufipedis]|uniref:L-type lectin-like domain-containing protein n=1 Tax=Ophiocordyceps camponoti-rufipedis TaxID=2004952 RepID=A0A2C5Z993_9HYPO|nr:hypothetical protein CDD80_1591 [Ophiocordyceps camponoti-rufipedis]